MVEIISRHKKKKKGGSRGAAGDEESGSEEERAYHRQYHSYPGTMPYPSPHAAAYMPSPGELLQIKLGFKFISKICSLCE